MIKPLTLEDSLEVYNLVDISRPNLTNLVWAKDATLSSTQKFIEEKLNSEDIIYGSFIDNTLIAVLELRKKDSFLELGYWIGTPHRHKGYMREAVKLLVDEVNHTSTIIAHIREKNFASHKVLEHAGLIYSHTEIWNDEPWIHFKKDKLVHKPKP